LLRPVAKKLTLIDARRVMSIYEDAMRRVELVSGLLEQTSITAVVQHLRTFIGSQLVDALAGYSGVLDIFDEVISWRQMAIGSARSPLPQISDVDRRSAVEDATESIRSREREDSILAMLFKDDEEPLEPQSSLLQPRFSTFM